MTSTPKEQLRVHMRQMSLAISEEARSAASKALAQHLLGFVDSHPQLTSIVGFKGFRDEVDMRFFEAGVQERQISYRMLTESDILAEAPDLLIIPGVAFDLSGRRLGRGKGYYDKLLSSLRAHSQIIAIGVGYDHQVLDSVPKEAHDEAVDFLCTPARGLVECHRNFSRSQSSSRS